MGFAETMRILSNINCGLASLNTYGEQRLNGVSPQVATFNLFGNLTNGIARNEIAYGMQKCGKSWGNTVNLFAGYGNPVSNTVGTLGLMSACTPWMYFNAMPMMGFGYPCTGFYSPMGMGFSPMGCISTGLFC